MPKDWESKLREAIDREQPGEYDNDGLVFGALVVSLLEQMGYDPASETAIKMIVGTLTASMILAKLDHVNFAMDGVGKSIFVMLCNEEQAMRAAQLAHALSQTNGDVH